MHSTIFAALLLFGPAEEPCLFDVYPFGPAFNCKPYRIEHTIMDLVLPMCTDTIELCVGVPIPQKHAASPVDTPVRMYDLGPLGEQLDEPRRMEITWTFDEQFGRIMVVPLSPMPVHEPGDYREIRYRITIDCRYWNGETRADDTVKVDVVKQHLIRAYAEARSIHDSTLLSDQIYAMPPSTSPIHFVSDGVWIDVEDEAGSWEFSHWTSSDGGVVVEPTQPTQHIIDVCWPLKDTVVFTAWFKDVNTSIDEQRGGGLDIYWNHALHVLEVGGLQSPASIAVIDVNGRTVGSTISSSEQDHVSIPLSVVPSIYAVVVTTTAGRHIQPVFIQ